jgi:hypothetical protein
MKMWVVSRERRVVADATDLARGGQEPKAMTDGMLKQPCRAVHRVSQSWASHSSENDGVKSGQRQRLWKRGEEKEEWMFIINLI